MTVRISLDDLVRLYDDDVRVAEYRLQPATQGWVTVPAHHATLWRPAIRLSDFLTAKQSLRRH